MTISVKEKAWKLSVMVSQSVNGQNVPMMTNVIIFESMSLICFICSCVILADVNLCMMGSILCSSAKTSMDCFVINT